MKRILLAVAVLTMALVPFRGSGQDKPQRDAILAEMMQKKVKSAQLVLEGIATADSKKIANNAEELIRIAKSTTWPLILSPQYDTHHADFVRAAEKLVQKAKDKNTDGAALAYIEMTLSCVRCHQYVRERRRDARLDLEVPPASLASYSGAASRNLDSKSCH
jgi:cytochrome c556